MMIIAKFTLQPTWHEYYVSPVITSMTDYDISCRYVLEYAMTQRKKARLPRGGGSEEHGTRTEHGT